MTEFIDKGFLIVARIVAALHTVNFNINILENCSMQLILSGCLGHYEHIK